jgi:hypothetical protein
VQIADYRTIQQRNLNNAFAYDLVPSPSVLTAALKAARRVNDFPTAVRIFEGTSFSASCIDRRWRGKISERPTKRTDHA